MKDLLKSPYAFQSEELLMIYIGLPELMSWPDGLFT